jgi:4-carboxymuconolactone decarboxylase
VISTPSGDRRSFLANTAAVALVVNSGGLAMAQTPSPARQAFGDIAPALADYTDAVLFGDVWKRPNLSPRDRSLVTIASLISLYRHNELPFHLKRALDNGVTKDEIIETITHLAFYGGWPVANTALPIARKVFEDAGA